jgi:uncharacterized membrane protein YgdD (TMEM256/DUF423 family)
MTAEGGTWLQVALRSRKRKRKLGRPLCEQAEGPTALFQVGARGEAAAPPSGCAAPAGYPASMTRPPSQFVRWGAVLGFLGVAAGTFGAHGLERVTAEVEALDWWSTGVLYHLVHALALLVAGLLAATQGAGERASRALTVAGWAFGVGVVVFSGTLYALALGAPRWLGAITPLGGVAFLTGWVSLARAR